MLQWPSVGDVSAHRGPRARQVMWRRVQLDDRMRAACRSSIVRCLLVPVVAVLAFYHWLHMVGEWYACYLLAISFVA